MNYFDFKDKVAVVFGADSRIGKLAALGYGDCGAKVAILAKNKSDLDDLFKEMGDKGYIAAAFECDVTDEESIKNSAKEIVERFGRIDILFNNSGVIQHGSVEELTEEEWNTSMNVNVRSAYLAMKYLVPEMKKNNYGKIVNTSSASAISFSKDDVLVRHAYNVSKAAMVGLTKATAATYMKDGITVNAIGLGIFEDELKEEKDLIKNYLANNPSGRLGKMEELIGTIMYLSSDASNYVTGQLLLVDGGVTLV
ncbi:SDR family NAD(P)-dependent oxidoreductase [Miniphocaeibacter halophilus]|uniref:SDR family oxidoreductase n=1 Tax=Miniphocaeibacter halophilus TaxID=2931922 RepID=A0AC61MSN0_9FIRM|nr:SDR family oxidoreductase [Miniphocaeibacter halophilus]QQK08665.1 SDR family oxidoreductase [Miniphocaeibacter halophilus]